MWFTVLHAGIPVGAVDLAPTGLAAGRLVRVAAYRAIAARVRAASEALARAARAGAHDVDDVRQPHRDSRGRSGCRDRTIRGRFRASAGAATPSVGHTFGARIVEYGSHQPEVAMAGQGSAGNVIAALCSFFIPGLGQLLQGRLMKAIFQFVLAAVLWIILMGWIIHLWSILDAATWKPRS